MVEQELKRPYEKQWEAAKIQLDALYDRAVYSPREVVSKGLEAFYRFLDELPNSIKQLETEIGKAAPRAGTERKLRKPGDVYACLSQLVSGVSPEKLVETYSRLWRAPSSLYRIKQKWGAGEIKKDEKAKRFFYTKGRNKGRIVEPPKRRKR